MSDENKSMKLVDLDYIRDAGLKDVRDIALVTVQNLQKNYAKFCSSSGESLIKGSPEHEKLVGEIFMIVSDQVPDLGMRVRAEKLLLQLFNISTE
jgi:hypothetical protein